jgi:hypothetical protein
VELSGWRNACKSANAKHLRTTTTTTIDFRIPFCLKAFTQQSDSNQVELPARCLNQPTGLSEAFQRYRLDGLNIKLQQVGYGQNEE